MTNGTFKYEDDLLKHHVRTEAWLPVCKKRLEKIRQNCPPKKLRRLKYFTFTAVGAIDVLMLDVARIIRPSKEGFFDTVYFFDKTNDRVIETRKRIPGAIGFPSEFVELILLNDPEEYSMVAGPNPLNAPQDQRDESAVRNSQTQLAQRQNFIKCFPFDVINLDLEEFLFKPKDPLPGKMVNAFRKLFAWQQIPLSSPSAPHQVLEGFSLMFTTQIGPKNVGNDYLNMLCDRLETNINADEGLKSLLIKKTGYHNAKILQKKDFDTFFKLAVPKLLMNILMEEDWYIEPESGISIYEFDRDRKSVV
jgi:hypothetical protein